VIEVVDEEAARRALAAGVLRCPCGGRLRRWGHARPRTVRELANRTRLVQPDRGRCRACGTTHVVLAAELLRGRAYTIGVIGAALVGASRGEGHRRLARRLTVPAGTARGWLRRARANAEDLHRLAVTTVVSIDQELLPASAPCLDRVGQAVAALAAAALAIVRRFGGDERNLWPVIVTLTRGRLLAPSSA
jgi:hypothetical protein